MHIPIIEVKGFEADDLIEQPNKLKRKLQSLYGNPDKDFAQLVSENIFMYKPARMGNGIEICVPSFSKIPNRETGTSD
jgi:DNA polymerase-1